MSWSIFVKGEATRVAEAVANAKAYPASEEAAQEQIEQAKVLILAEIDEMVEGVKATALESQHPSDAGLEVDVKVFVSVEASGHHDGADNRNLTIKVNRLPLLL